MDIVNNEQVNEDQQSTLPSVDEQINKAEVVAEDDTKKFFCSNCGAPLKYKPHSDYLICEFCHTKTEIPKEATVIEELSYDDYADLDADSADNKGLVSEKVVTCTNCGGSPTVNESLKTLVCPYCGSPLIESNIREERLIRPSYVLPFNIENDDVKTLLSKWIKGLWFAPNKLCKGALSPQNLNGIYLPYWTYDAETDTQYTGERGTTYTVEVGSGNDRRTETRIRWTYTSGSVSLSFDDVMVPASATADHTRLRKLGGFDNCNLLKYNESYLRGFITEKYTINLKQGLIDAKEIMVAEIKSAIKDDIGGDQQRISSMSTDYFNITFKHVLVPIYISSYFYKQKLYQFYVNGRTGRITGDRPYSWIKITLFSLFICAILGLIYYFQSKHK